jgi:hypothetical protein
VLRDDAAVELNAGQIIELPTESEVAKFSKEQEKRDLFSCI